MTFGFEAIPHEALTPDVIGQLSCLFHTEYSADFGPWTPELPYGYAGHDVHILAWSDETSVGHLGWLAAGRRTGKVSGLCRSAAKLGARTVADDPPPWARSRSLAFRHDRPPWKSVVARGHLSTF